MKSYMRSPSVAAALLTAIACSTKDSATPDTASGGMGAVAGAPATPGGGNAAGMAATGDADHDFLLSMSDQHKGLIAMAHETIDSKQPLGVKSLAERLDSEQDAEMDWIATMLDSVFKDAHTPTITPAGQAMLDSLKGKSGAAYDRAFLENAIRSHLEAIRLIDEYVPKATKPEVKEMAGKMKSARQKEIAEFQAKLKST